MHRFNARFAELAALLDAARAACRAARLDPEATHRVELVLEEAFSNSVRHGYGGDSDAPIWLASRILPDGLELVYQDAATPFDSLRDVALPKDGRPGGVGRVLIKSLPRSAHYALIDGRNTLRLEFGGSAEESRP
jgi:anti-sigma regulatory factor (Ser/Thr protein kinase)